MCLAIPAKVEELENGMANCRVGDSETYVKASLMLLDPPPQIGDYLIIHAGFAIRILDPKEAEESLAVLREMAQLQTGQTGF
ncbi:MAG: HypC/HybG/HupF family hydrogenase formation chaperone [Desulfovibrio sp.]|nr:MAG: HypC/HybG/HupF family hydrogenase formation chaperone [Desulfovibrio sp.]